MATYQLERAEGKITVRVLHEGKVINGTYYPKGYIHVISGVNGEEYAFPPDVGRNNYRPNKAFLRELEEANR